MGIESFGSSKTFRDDCPTGIESFGPSRTRFRLKSFSPSPGDRRLREL